MSILAILGIVFLILIIGGFAIWALKAVVGAALLFGIGGVILLILYFAVRGLLMA